MILPTSRSQKNTEISYDINRCGWVGLRRYLDENLKQKPTQTYNSLSRKLGEFQLNSKKNYTLIPHFVGVNPSTWWRVMTACPRFTMSRIELDSVEMSF